MPVVFGASQGASLSGAHAGQVGDDGVGGVAVEVGRGYMS